MDDPVIVSESRLVPSKRLDVLENHYTLMNERPVLYPRYAKLVRHIIHYGLFNDVPRQEPIHAFLRKNDDKFVILRGNARALAYHILKKPIPVHIATQYDFMREDDRGNPDEVRRGKERIVKALNAVERYRVECRKENIHRLDDLLKPKSLTEYWASYQSSIHEAHSRVEDYDTKRYERRKDEQGQPKLVEPSFDDIPASGLEMENKDVVPDAFALLFEYIKGRNGHV